MRMRRRTTILSVLAAGVTAIAMMLGLPGVASAEIAFPDFTDKPYHRVHVWGDIDVFNDTTSWSLHLQEGISPSPICVFLRVEIDRTLASDPAWNSSTICAGNHSIINFGSDNVGGPKHYSRTRGARVKVEWVNSGNIEVVYVKDS
jgi:hypothetical protein